MNLEIYNSYCHLTGNVPQNVRDLVTQVLTYRNDIEAEKANIFYQMNMAKKFGNQKKYGFLVGQLKKLEENEWVCWFKEDKFPTGHLNIIREVMRELNAEVTELDHRVIPSNDLILKWNNHPHVPRYYQDAMIAMAPEAGRGVFESAVGSGKSLIMAYVIKNLANISLIVVPSIGLGLQLYNDFVTWFGRQKVQLIETSDVRKQKNLAPIRIITVQSLASLQKTQEIWHLIHDVNALFVDEIHHAGSASYTNLLNDLEHVYYRFGFTGTFLRNDSKSLDMWGFLSNILYRYPAHKAIEDGFLTPIDVSVHRLNGVKKMNYHKEYEANYCGSPEILMKVREIVESAPGQQILILVKQKDKAGLIFHEYLTQCGIQSTYVSGDNKKEEVNQAIKDFNDKKVNVLIGSSVIGEGIDVRSADHLIMCQGGKSEIVIVQATGRLVRLFEGKFIGHYHDFDFQGTKYMQKHLKQRIDIVQRNFAPKSINYY